MNKNHYIIYTEKLNLSDLLQINIFWKSHPCPKKIICFFTYKCVIFVIIKFIQRKVDIISSLILPKSSFE